MKIAIAQPASTVILVRENSGLEVYMTKRNSNLGFLGGFYVFPGGRRDEADFNEETLSRMRAKDLETKASAIEGNERKEERLGYYAGAIREVFEEIGVLIVCDKEGKRVEINSGLKNELERMRLLLHKRKISFTEVLKRFGFHYDLDRLIWFAHWITPKTSPKRFDTQFFIGKIPPEQEPMAFPEEIEFGLWIKPKQALEKWKKGEMNMIPPTIASLDRLTKFSSLEELSQALALS